MKQPEVYISHAWGGESDDVMMKIVKRLEAEKIRVVYDHKDLKYRGKISEFMKELGKAKAVVIILSNKYLHSEYCMFELLNIYENSQFLHRIFPVVLDEVDIAKSTQRIELVKYWEGQHAELEAKMRELKSLSYIEGITDDLNLYSDIRRSISKLTYILRDINTLNIKLHTEEKFHSLTEQIKEALTSEVESDVTPLEWRERAVKMMPWRMFGGVAFFLSLFLVIYFGFFFNPTIKNATSIGWEPWIGNWKQEVKSSGAQPIKGTITLTYKDNKLSGVVKNKYPDRSTSTNTLYDISLDETGTKLSGKWKSEDLLNQFGDFEWHLSGDEFTGFYTLQSKDVHFTWNGKR